MVAAAPVFADVDTGVDDAIALIYLLASPDAELVGIASTGGNVGVEQVCENNLGLLDLCRVDGVPVSKGAARPLNSAKPARRQRSPWATRPGLCRAAVDRSGTLRR